MMGSGASKTVPGVTANPRVLYSEQLSRKEKAALCIDAPVLVDMQHGSVRYREDARGTVKENREIPHEGSTDLDQKKHYFYHARLQKISTDADRTKEDAFKFYYVTKGPARTNAKKLFYVYGKGWDAKDCTHVKPTQTTEEGDDFAWPRRHGPSDLVYNIQVTGYTPAELEGGDWEEKCLLENWQSTPDRSEIRLKVKSGEQVSSIKACLAVKLLKAAANISICHKTTLLRNEDVLGDLRPQEERSPAILDVLLTLV